MKIILSFLCGFILFGNNANAMADEDAPARQTAVVRIDEKEPEKDRRTEKEINDSLAEKGDKVAIKRKIQGLVEGAYGYEKNLAAAKEFNEMLVAKGFREAIAHKIAALMEGAYGYERNPVAAREFNDSLAENGDEVAIARKIQGLVEGAYGYEKNLAAAKEFNEVLVMKGNQNAIARKIEALARLTDSYSLSSSENTFTYTYPTYGYEKNLAAARELNDALVEKGDQKAIARKIEALTRGGDQYCEVINEEEGFVYYYPTYGYVKNPTAAREFNDSLVEKGDEEAIARKIEGLTDENEDDGGYQSFHNSGYERNLAAARALNNELGWKGDSKAIKRKLEGLGSGRWGYEQNLEALK